MAKNQNGGVCHGLCHKIHKKVRRTSHSQSPPLPVPDQKKPATEPNSVEIPITSDTPQTHASAPKNGLGHTQMGKVAPAGVAAAQEKAAKPMGQPDNDVGDDHDHEREFSEFIKSSKAKIRAPSNVGEKKRTSTVSRADSLNDRITDYITQARLNITRTTTLKPGGKRSVSMK